MTRKGFLPRCANLRNKAFYGNLTFHPSGMDSGGTPCWCFKTQQVFGPDGELVSPSDCTPERRCYEKMRDA